jgi:peptide deformylase
MKIVTDREQLSIPCEPCSKEEGLKIAEDLLCFLLTGVDEAVGLAANQVGIQKQVFVLLIDGQYKGFINPTLISQTNPILVKGEGCLSFPGLTLNTTRCSEIYVSDILEPTPHLLTGLWAIAFLHEKDHIDGITFHSRL